MFMNANELVQCLIVVVQLSYFNLKYITTIEK